VGAFVLLTTGLMGLFGLCILIRAFKEGVIAVINKHTAKLHHVGSSYIFLRNVKVVRYLANCTSTLQPLDLGIIHSLKAYYRKHLVQTSICLMESGKEVRKKINVLEAMHYIMAAWQQVSQQTIQNCFRKAGHKYQSDGNEMANDDDDDDDFGQDWEDLCRAQRYDFQSYVSVDCHYATSGIETVEELCEAFGSTRSVEEVDENEQEMVPSFAEIYEALQKVKVFF
jgi:hypothetical protein